MAFTKIIDQSDRIGMLTSGLCLVHCIATPFLFVAQAGLSQGEGIRPGWWGSLDIIFLVVSLVAVYWSARNTSRRILRIAFWIFWAILAAIVLNEKWELIHLSEAVIYLPTLALITLHIYNHRYCR